MENIIVAFLNNLPPLVLAVGVMANIYISYRNNKKLDTIGTNVDGKMEQLLTVNKAASKAEGRLQEKDRPDSAVEV